jgi:hypothetical protein
MNYVYEVLPDEFDEDTVWKAIEKFNYDPDQAVEYLLNPPKKEGKKKSKQEGTEKKGERDVIRRD